MDYPRLLLDFSAIGTPHSFWNSITRVGSQDSKKAPCLQHSAHRYIHALLSRKITGNGDNTRVETRLGLYMMYGMIAHVPINMGCVIAELITSQGQNPKLGASFIRPYITYLVRGMDTLDCVQSMELIRGTIPLGLLTLCAIKIVEHWGQEFILARHLKSDEEKKHEGEPHTPPFTHPG